MNHYLFKTNIRQIKNRIKNIKLTIKHDEIKSLSSNNTQKLPLFIPQITNKNSLKLPLVKLLFFRHVVLAEEKLRQIFKDRFPGD